MNEGVSIMVSLLKSIDFEVSSEEGVGRVVLSLELVLS